MFTALVFISCRIPALFLPFGWGNDTFNLKWNELQEEKSSVSRLFLGSSRIYRSVNTALLDSLLDSAGHSGFSYNLAAEGTYPPQSYYLLERVIKEAPTELTFIYHELHKVMPEAKINQKSKASIYWHTPKESFFFTGSWLSSDQSKLQGLGDLIRQWGLLLKRMFQIHLLRPAWHVISKPQAKIAAHQKGYQSLELAVEHAPEAERQKLIDRQSDFIANLAELEKRTERANQLFVRKPKPNSYFSAHKKRLKQLIRLAKDKDIQLVFIATPRSTSIELIELFRSLPKENRIDLADSEQYPGFYTRENAFDIGHLNERGARLFTQELAKHIVTAEHSALDE